MWRRRPKANVGWDEPQCLTRAGPQSPTAQPELFAVLLARGAPGLARHGRESHAGACSPSAGRRWPLHLTGCQGVASGHWHQAARRWVRCSARLVTGRVESFSWRASWVNNGGNPARFARQHRARPPAPAFVSPLLSKSFQIKRGRAGKQHGLERIKASGAHVLARDITVKCIQSGKKPHLGRAGVPSQRAGLL